MEQWNSDDDLEILYELERDVILMNSELRDLEVPSKFGKFKKNVHKTKKDKATASLESWIKYRYLVYLYEGLPENEKKKFELDKLYKFGEKKFDEKNFNEFRKELSDKTYSTKEYSQFNRNIKKQLNLIIYYILENYGETFEKEKMYYIVSGAENAKENSMSDYDWEFWGELYENRERAKALVQKKIRVADITEDDKRLLSIIHTNFARIAKRKKSHIEKTSFEEMWKNIFYEMDLERTKNEVISYLERLKKLILEKNKDEEYLDFLDNALEKLKNIYNTLSEE